MLKKQIHVLPTSRKNKASGFTEKYTFQGVETLTLEVETNVGGWVRLPKSDSDRVLIMKRGNATASFGKYPMKIEEGNEFDVPAGTDEMELYGQFEYFCLNTSKEQIKHEAYKGSWKALETSQKDRLLIVKDGAGMIKIGKTSFRLEANVIVELPAGQEGSMINGNIEYSVVTAK